MYIDSNPVHESPESVLGAQFTVSFTVYIFSVSESSSGIEYSDILLFVYLLISNKKMHPVHLVIIKQTLYAHITRQLNYLFRNTPTQRDFSKTDAQ